MKHKEMERWRHSFHIVSPLYSKDIQEGNVKSNSHCEQLNLILLYKKYVRGNWKRQSFGCGGRCTVNAVVMITRG